MRRQSFLQEQKECGGHQILKHHKYDIHGDLLCMAHFHLCLKEGNSEDQTAADNALQACIPFLIRSPTGQSGVIGVIHAQEILNY
eukprot:scaffold29558_cov17-Tisochrysis_lutea.AAC.2